MKKHFLRANGDSIHKPSYRGLAIVLLVFLASILVTGMMVRLSERREVEQQRADLSDQAQAHAHTIQRGTERALSATFALAALVRQGNGNIANFEATATQMLPYYPGVASLQLAPGGVVTHIVPLAGNEKAIGHNLLLDSTRDKEAIRARDTGQLTLAGPFNLVQGGGLAAVGRLPVFLDDQAGKPAFWGFTTVLIRLPKALEEAQLNKLTGQGVGYELSRIHPDTLQKQVIAASSTTTLIDPVVQSIAVPNGSWNLSIAPVKGWGYPMGHALRASAALVLSFLLAYVASLLVRLRASRRVLETLVERRTAEISAVQIKLRATLDAIPDLVWLTSTDGSLLDCNPMFERFTGVSKTGVIAEPTRSTYETQPAQGSGQHDLGVFALANSENTEGWLTSSADGHSALFEISKTPMHESTGALVGILHIAHDVTARYEAEVKIKRLSQLYAALSQCNQAIVRCTTDIELFSQICADVVKFGGMKMAWIGMVDTDSQQLRPVARAGSGLDYLDGLPRLTVAAAPVGLGPEAVAVCEQRPVWTQDFMRGSQTQAWQERATAFGWGSIAALPLERDGVTVGSFSLYAEAINAFEEHDVRELLLEMVTNINYALANFDSEMRRQQAEKNLQLAANVFTHAREAIMITTADGTIVEVNAAFSRITGYSHDEVLGQNPRILNSGRQGQEQYAAMWRELSETGQWYGEIWNRRKNGEVYAEMQTISTVRDANGNVEHYVAQFSDITVLKKHEHELKRIANFDALTGLPNRVLLADHLQRSMTLVRRSDKRLAVVYVDLDDFKSINDKYKHEIGDQLLIRLAENIQSVLRKSDYLARLGSDEFVVVFEDLTDIEVSEPMTNRLLKAIAMPFQVGEIEVQLAASLGVTIYPQDADVNPDQLLRQADQAMYHAKLAGKNRCYVFDAEHDRNLRGHHESQELIRQALTKNEFVLHYQPKVDMRTGVVVGVEALIRWQHPQRGLLPPGDFLPTIENHPLACEIGEWVIATALDQIVSWQMHGLTMPISVNVGARQLQQEDFVLRLRALLAAQPQAMPGMLELEVLETSALEDLAHISNVIAECRSMGINFALDDFGTGYSSLSYLRRLAVIQLKIDQSFVRDMTEQTADLAILAAVIGLAGAFQLQVIAEGIETVEQGALLLKLGCKLGQGYFIARPMPADALPEWVAHWQPDPIWLQVA